MSDWLYIASDLILSPTPLHESAVLVRDGRITAIGDKNEVPRPQDAQVVNATGLILAPGFVDLQINGGFGFDFTEQPETIWEVGARLPRYGVTAFLPTIITSPPETVRRAQEVIRQGPPIGYKGAVPLGLHIEGPFLNPLKRGAHNPQFLRPPYVESIADWSPERGVRLVTLAPELPGALAVTRELVSRGVVVSAGHSAANWGEACAGIEAGVRYGTHLFNAMSPLDHREPGLPGALLTHPAVTVGLIADGIHLHPAVVALAWQAKGSHRVNLVTDAMSALGMPPGAYSLANREVTVSGGAVRLDDGTLAGSVLSLDQAVRNLLAFTNCSREQAIGSVTEVAANVLGMQSAWGKIAVGMQADMVLLTPELRVTATIIGGRLAYTSPDYLRYRQSKED